MHYTDIYLEFETLFGLPGVGPGTLSSRVRGEGNDPFPARATGKLLFISLVYLFY